jgi:hypothetical protein
MFRPFHSFWKNLLSLFPNRNKNDLLNRYKEAIEAIEETSNFEIFERVLIAKYEVEENLDVKNDDSIGQSYKYLNKRLEKISDKLNLRIFRRKIEEKFNKEELTKEKFDKFTECIDELISFAKDLSRRKTQEAQLVYTLWTFLIISALIIQREIDNLDKLLEGAPHPNDDILIKILIAVLALLAIILPLAWKDKIREWIRNELVFRGWYSTGQPKLFWFALLVNVLSGLFTFLIVGCILFLLQNLRGFFSNYYEGKGDKLSEYTKDAKSYKGIKCKDVDFNRFNEEESKKYFSQKLANISAAEYIISSRLKPDEMRLHCKLGLTYEDLQEYHQALSSYKVAEKASGDPNIGIAISGIYLRQKNYTEADNWLWTVITRDSNNNESPNILQNNAYARDILKRLVHYYIEERSWWSANRWLSCAEKAQISDDELEGLRTRLPKARKRLSDDRQIAVLPEKNCL